jgi:hypothetical protein
MPDQSSIITALADPTLPADDSACAAALSVPVLTPRPGRVTLTTLAAAGVWGFAKVAAFRSALSIVVASGSSNGALAGTLLDVLAGEGFDPSDPQAPAMAPAFVGLSGNAITDADARAALYLVSYRCGGPVTAGDVTAARAAMSAATTLAATVATAFAARASGVAQAQAGAQAVIALWDAYCRAVLAGQTATAPTTDQIAAAFAAGK